MDSIGKRSGSGPPDRPDKWDVGHATSRAVLSAIPVIGGPLLELIGLAITPSLEQRRDAWFRDLNERLVRLEAEERLRMQELAANDVFVDALLRATQAAMRTGNEEKLAALRNAVLNAALPEPPDAALQQMFLVLLDDFTEWHIRMLKLFQEPQGWAKGRGHVYPQLTHPGLEKIAQSAYPQLTQQIRFGRLVWRNLEQAMFVQEMSFEESRPAKDSLYKRTTDLGDAFLRFIEDPAVEHAQNRRR